MVGSCGVKPGCHQDNSGWLKAKRDLPIQPPADSLESQLSADFSSRALEHIACLLILLNLFAPCCKLHILL